MSAEETQEFSRECEVMNEKGLHARPAAAFVKEAGRYSCSILVTKDGNTVSGKSLLGLLTLEASLGTTIQVTTKGEDAEEALEALVSLIKNRFMDVDGD